MDVTSVNQVSGVKRPTGAVVFLSERRIEGGPVEEKIQLGLPRGASSVVGEVVEDFL